MDKKEIVKQLKDRGYPYERIGAIVGVSRQRVHQILTGYISPSHFNKNDCTEIPPEWLPDNAVDSSGIKLEGRSFLREVVRKRDNYTCQICGQKWVTGTRRFDVHHIDESIEGEKAFVYKNNKDFEKMITLCHKCHLNLEQVRKKIKKGVVDNLTK